MSYTYTKTHTKEKLFSIKVDFLVGLEVEGNKWLTSQIVDALNTVFEINKNNNGVIKDWSYEPQFGTSLPTRVIRIVHRSDLDSDNYVEGSAFSDDDWYNPLCHDSCRALAGKVLDQVMNDQNK